MPMDCQKPLTHCTPCTQFHIPPIKLSDTYQYLTSHAVGVRVLHPHTFQFQVPTPVHSPASLWCLYPPHSSKKWSSEDFVPCRPCWVNMRKFSNVDCYASVERQTIHLYLDSWIYSTDNVYLHICKRKTAMSKKVHSKFPLLPPLPASRLDHAF